MPEPPQNPPDQNCTDRKPPTPSAATVRLRPKKQLGAAPWAYADMLVMDRRTKALAPGTLARLEDGTGAFLGLGALNPRSKIAWRWLDGDGEALIDAAWAEARARTALALRQTLYDAPYYRLIHAEADGMPGVVVDRFGDALAVQPNAAWAERHLEALSAGLLAATGARVLYKNASGRTRALEGLDDRSCLLAGALDGPLPVPSNGATYFADLTAGQKTGFFFDQRPNHAFAARLARGGRVLDVFSHVGGFGLAALAAGAAEALAVDSSAAALALAREGAAASGVSARFGTLRRDGFDAMAALAAEGRRFELVVCDPPAFAPSKQALEAGLRAYEKVAKLAASLVAQGGFLVLCSCSHAADLAAFRAACLRGIGRARRRPQIVATGGAGPDHPVHPHLAESGYLKALFFRLLP